LKKQTTMRNHSYIIAAIIFAALAIGLGLASDLWAQPPSLMPQPNKPVPWGNFLAMLAICGAYGVMRIRSHLQ